MVTVILIGFRYTKKPILGVLADLFKVYKYFTLLGYEVHTITDIKDVEFNDEIKKTQQSSEILSFAEKICTNSLENLTLISSVESDKQLNKEESRCEFLNVLSKIEFSHRTIVYFTGHAKYKRIELPNGKYLPFLVLANFIYEKMEDRDVSLCFIFDCCKASDLNLPYFFDGNRFRLRQNILHAISVNEIEPFLPCNVLLINSSKESENSLATDVGSFFTTSLFSYLQNVYERKESDIRLSKLYRTVNEEIEKELAEIESNEKDSTKKLGKQTASIYSSRPFIPILWTWLYSTIELNFF
jgi:Caspase domain.